MIHKNLNEMLKIINDSIVYIKTPEGSFALTSIIVAIIGVIVVIYFGIRSDKENSEEKDIRKAGVIDEGVDSTYVNCEGIRSGAGLISKGKGLKSINSKWSSRNEPAEAQRQKFEENKKNYLDPRNSNK